MVGCGRISFSVIPLGLQKSAAHLPGCERLYPGSQVAWRLLYWPAPALVLTESPQWLTMTFIVGVEVVVVEDVTMIAVEDMEEADPGNLSQLSPPTRPLSGTSHPALSKGISTTYLKIKEFARLDWCTTMTLGNLKVFAMWNLKMFKV